MDYKDEDILIDENFNQAGLNDDDNFIDVENKEDYFLENRENENNLSNQDNQYNEQDKVVNDFSEDDQADIVDEKDKKDNKEYYDNKDNKDKLINSLQRQIDTNELLKGDLSFVFKPLEEKANNIFSFLDESGESACAKSVYYALALENFDNILSQVEKNEYEKALQAFCEIEKSSNQSLYSEAKNKKTISSMNDKEFEQFCKKAIAGEYSSLK